MLKHLVALVLFSFIILLSVASQREVAEVAVTPPLREEVWADSVFNVLTPKQRLGQLFMVAAYSNRNEEHYATLEGLVRNQGIGGVIFFQGGPMRQAVLTNRYQGAAKVPLLVAMDAEWGLGMRLDSTISYPRQMTLGAIKDNKHVYDLGTEIARQCRRLGVHINFAPVADVNSNPNNPVIGVRSFGENKENVAAKASSYMKGLQDHQVMACAKHFPGHGDTETDSHLTLPVINHSKERLTAVELYPFRRLIADSVMSVMVAHINVPTLDKTKNRPTTLSRAVVTDLLKNELGFRGLVFTDALNMKGVSQFYKPGEVDVQALLAGNDVLLFSEDVPQALTLIEKAIKSRKLKQNELDGKVKRILRAKYRLGLNRQAPVRTENLVRDLNGPRSELLRFQLYEQAITVVRNREGLLPFKHLDTTEFASVTINGGNDSYFQSTLSKYATFRHYQINGGADSGYANTLQRVQTADVVVVSLHGMNNSAGQAYGLSRDARQFVEVLSRKTRVVVCVMGNPYSLKYFEGNGWLVCGFEDNAITRQLVPQILFGALPAVGRLPVSAGGLIPAGTGSSFRSLNRLGYAPPESVGMSSGFLGEIDHVVSEAIQGKEMPGCQVLVAKHGKVVFSKAYGHQTYDSTQAVTSETVYDLASVTKVAATLQAIMFLHERKLLDINEKVSTYLPELVGTNKQDLLVRDVLMHQAGLLAFIPYYERTLTKSGPDPAYYSHSASPHFSREVAPGLYSLTAIRDSVWKWTVDSRLLKMEAGATQQRYEYSDLSFYFLQQIAERLLNQPINDFLAQNFYQPLGCQTLGYRPLERLPLEQIAPTEDDKLFRHQLIRGTVHDQGAALLGGVAGHAGLFGTANDLAILLQMNLQKGTYGGQRYLLEPTLGTFIKSYNKGNRRGLGWDKPIPSGGGYVSDFASRNSFGHSGFTGTFVWVDPNEELVYIFLSNRIYPSAENTKLISNKTRRRVQDLVYKSIINYQTLYASGR